MADCRLLPTHFEKLLTDLLTDFNYLYQKSRKYKYHCYFQWKADKSVKDQSHRKQKKLNTFERYVLSECLLILFNFTKLWFWQKETPTHFLQMSTFHPLFVFIFPNSLPRIRQNKVHLHVLNSSPRVMTSRSRKDRVYWSYLTLLKFPPTIHYPRQNSSLLFIIWGDISQLLWRQTENSWNIV